MKIRIIGEKTEIENFLKRMSEIVPDVSKSKLYPAREGGYRCYIDINSKYLDKAVIK